MLRDCMEQVVQVFAGQAFRQVLMAEMEERVAQVDKAAQVRQG